MEKSLNKAYLLLDTLGVHPDLKTAWDIVPLSFVVDYFIPVGDILESLHPRGWAPSCYQFTGYQSLSLTTIDTYYVSNSSYTLGLNPYIRKRYQRSYLNTSVGAHSPVKWSAPSLKEIFNTAYLTTTLKKLF
jgi:hypothetical protein